MRKELKNASIRLSEKLSRIDLACSGISKVNQRSLDRQRQGMQHSLGIYARLLDMSLGSNQAALDRTVIVDYGGGSGTMSMMAKELGIGTVVYADVYDGSCADAGRLGELLGLPIDHTVCGDIDELISYLSSNSICVNAVVSFDVIEHIYDVESHFEKLIAVPGRPIRFVYASGANIANSRYVRKVTKLQLSAEFENDREQHWGDWVSNRAFLDMRKEIISAHEPKLNSKQVNTLARRTRGLKRSYIEKCVDEYRETGEITYEPSHPTNTCDPVTGNWCEHLMDPGWLLRTIKGMGFSVNVSPGLLPVFGPVHKKCAKLCVNAAIRTLGRRGFFLAHYYVVCADLDVNRP